MRTILHCDLNNFYASVEMKFHPEFYGRPLAVCGDPKKRHGIVLAKNQLAKKAGVITGEAIWQAQQKCPDLVLVPPHYAEYVKHSGQVFEIYKRYTDRVEPFGIDECWLDVTESLPLLGTGKEIADEIRERVKIETGLTVSVGVSFTKIFAKLGSDLKKPDATTEISPENFKSVVWPLEVSEMMMIGKKTAKVLNLMGIHTIGDLAAADVEALKRSFGKIAQGMHDNANGIETEEVNSAFFERAPKSVGNGTTTAQDMASYEDAAAVIYALSEQVAMRLRSCNMEANGVSLNIKYPDFEGISRQLAFDYSTSNATDLAEGALCLLKENHSFAKCPLRAVTVTAIKLTPEDSSQISFFDEKRDKESRLERAADKIRSKYGYSALRRGITLGNDVIIGHKLAAEDDFLPFKH